jgi:multiple sugar transport system permease protein
LQAAWLDGASKLRAFFDVTLPALLPTIFVVSLIRAIDSFKEFDKVFILTGGGPGTASELSSIYTWRMAFKQFDFGYAAALCVLIYVIVYFSSQFALGWARGRSAK